MTGLLSWAVRTTRLYLAFNMIHLSTNFQNGTVEDLKRARKVLANLKENKAEIRIPTLQELYDCEIRVYTNKTLGNLDNGVDSTAAFVIFMVNKVTNEATVRDWKANKVKRVVRSSLAAEALSLGEGLERRLQAEIKRTRKEKLIGMCD